MKKVYKPIVKKFLGHDVRVVNVDGKEYIVLKDMFDVLGRVKEDGGWTDAKNKTLEFLQLIGKKEDYELLEVLVKQGKIKTIK